MDDLAAQLRRAEAERRAALAALEAHRRFGGPQVYLSPADDPAQDARVGDFRQYIRRVVAADHPSLEVGPSYNPILPKAAGYAVTVVDHADEHALRSKYAAHGVDTSSVEPVDIVWREGKITDLVGGRRFAAVVASHVIEHVPDVVRFLQDCGEILADGGAVFLLVPDKRYCFDYFQPVSDVAKILGDHLRGASRHPFEAFYRGGVAATIAGPGGPQITWGQGPVSGVEFIGHDPAERFESAAASARSPDYVDAHANYFTPSTFAVIVNELSYLGLTDLGIDTLTRARGCEFLVVLRKNRGVRGMPAAEYNDLKKSLLLNHFKEEQERFALQADLSDGTTMDMPASGPPSAVPVKRLNWGCGDHTLPGWINSDNKEGPHIDLSCDIRDGLPLETGSIDYAVSIHALPEVPYDGIVPVLTELRRVLKPGGVLRLALPDLLKGVRAYERGDRDYFLVPDEDAKRLGAKLVLQLIWYGYSRTLFTFDFIAELLEKAGFERVTECAFRETRGPYPEIVDLDNREPETLFVEAVKPA